MKTISVLLGICLGVLVYLTIESKAPSYLSNDSKACANCHVMLSAYNTWQKSSHRNNAECIDCHIPHENTIRKYATKASDGFRHSLIFTTNTYDEVIKATPNAKSIIQQNCIRCHENLLAPTPAHNADLISSSPHDKTRNCTECHRHVPHGKGNSISTFQGIKSENGKVLSYPDIKEH